MIVRCFKLLFVCLAIITLQPAFSRDLVGGDFVLTDHNGMPFRLVDMRGKVVLMFFGYTSCPDICPTELGNIVRVLQRLEQHSTALKGIFITVDPDRDSAEILKSYVGYFNDNLLGLRGSNVEISDVAKQFRAKIRVEKKADGSVSVDHPANLFIVDQGGKLHAVVPYGLPVEHLVALVERLLDDKV